MMKLPKFPRRLQCPRHRQYNGRGEHAIRGGCLICRAMMDADEKARAFAAAVETFEALADSLAPEKRPTPRRRADDPTEAEQRGIPERTPFDDDAPLFAATLSPRDIIALKEAGR